MLHNYFKIALRNLRKNTVYSFINITGLAVGLTCFLLLLLYVQHETSYDNFHEKKDRIYRPGLFYGNAEMSVNTSLSPTALLPTMLRRFPEVETGTRVYNPSSFSPSVVRKGDNLFQETRLFYADSSFFEVFTFEMLAGDPEQALKQPRSIILTRPMLQKYFGNDIQGEDVLGESLTVNGNEYQITGLMEAPPANSHLKFDFLASFNTLSASKQEIWGSANYQTYIVLNEQADVAALQEKIKVGVEKAMGDRINKGDVVDYPLMPISDIHLYSDLRGELEPGGDIQYVYIFSFIALLVLVIACINYVNLATARAAERAQEVGIRKVLGAYKGLLRRQFLGEAALLTFISLGLGTVLTHLLLPSFRNLANRNIQLNYWENPEYLAILLVVGIVVTLLAGLYPAFSLARFLPVTVLKGSFSASAQGIWMRKSLVIFQFAVSIFLIVATLAVTRQLAFVQEKNLGYNKERVVVLPLDRTLNEQYEAFKTELERNEKVKYVSAASESPAQIDGGYSMNVEGMSEDESLMLNAVTISRDFPQTLDMKLVAGRTLNDSDFEALKTEKSEDKRYAFLINETTAKMLDWKPEEAIGKRASVNGRAGRIAGVVKDFHFASLHKPIGPLALFPEPSQFNILLVKLAPGDPAESINLINTVWREMAPHRPFEYAFLNQEFEALYQSEAQIGQVFSVFSLVAIIVACLGLFGLSAFTAQQRAKEIGIRKVLGASVHGIVVLLSKDFAVLLAIATLIGLPLAWWAMEQWLTQNFVYRIDINAFILLSAVAIVFLIAWLTISYQSLKAAMTNPIRTLRSE